MIDSTDRKIQKAFRKQIGGTVFRDAASVNLYRDLDGVTAKEHKLIRVRTQDNVSEISMFPDTIISEHLKKDVSLIRYFFFEPEEFERARQIMTEGK